MNHSQDSVQKKQRELKTLEQQETALLQQIQHRKSELAAIEQKLDTLKPTIEKKTEGLLTAQRVTLEREREDIDAKLKVCRDDLKKLSTERFKLEKQLEDIEKLIDDARETLKTIEAQQSEAITLTQKADDELDTAVEKRDALIEQQNDIKLRIIELEARQKDLEGLVEVSRQRVLDEEAKLAAIKQASADEIRAKEDTLARLNMQIRGATSQMIEFRKEEENVRAELANRHKILDDRDQNLRLREMKVEAGEDKILRNSNLMNL